MFQFWIVASLPLENVNKQLSSESSPANYRNLSAATCPNVLAKGKAGKTEPF